MRKPFYRKSHKCWYVKSETGAFIRLDPDETVAFELWRRMLAGRFSDGPLVTVQTLVAGYLRENETRRGENRFSILVHYMLLFVARFGAVPASKLPLLEVYDWLNEPKPKVEKWSAWTQYDAIQAVRMVFKWAKEEGKITVDPLRRLKLPTRRPREAVITPGQHAALVSEANSALRLYLIASRCGARPRQIREVTAQHVTDDFTRWVFPDHKTRGKTGRPLVVYCSPCLQTLSRLLVAKHPSGPLFRNTKGRAWTKDNLALALRRTRKRAKLPESVVAYAYRHTFATDALKAGLPLAEVAELLGHKDVRMVSEVYGHLDKHAGHMVAKAAFRR